MYLGIFVNTSLLLLIVNTYAVHEHAPFYLTSKCTKLFPSKTNVNHLKTFSQETQKFVAQIWWSFISSFFLQTNVAVDHSSTLVSNLKKMILAFKTYQNCDTWNWPCDKIRHNEFAFLVEFHQCWYPKKAVSHAKLVSILFHLSAFI